MSPKPDNFMIEVINLSPFVLDNFSEDHTAASAPLSSLGYYDH